jgi:chromosome segregation ATPase
MSRPKETPALVAAAASLVDELSALDALAEEARHCRMRTEKGLSRAARLLTDSVEYRARIEEKLRALVGEIEAARTQQQQSIQALLEVAHELDERSKERDTLLARFGALGATAAQVSALAVKLGDRRNEGAGEQELLERLGDIRGQMERVAAEARALAETAEAGGWTEIARQADALRQEVLSTQNKLAMAQRSLAARAPS